MLFSTPELDPVERQVLDQIVELRARLQHQISEPRHWVGLLRRVSFARAIQSSNSIEGYNVTLDDAVAITDDVEAENDDIVTVRAVQGYRDAMTYILQLADDPHFDYSLSLIRSLHYMMMRYDLDKRPGRWRIGPIFVHNEVTQETVYEGPDSNLVPALMDEFAMALEGTGDAIVRGAMAHLNLVMIHPFRDGNGRMARALQSLVIARDGILAPMFCSIEEYLGNNTQAYYDVLAEVGQGEWNPQHDARPWIRFCLTAHYRQATKFLSRVKTYERMWGYLERRVERAGIADRAIPTLLWASGGGRVRRAMYVSMADVSDDTASRELKALVDAELLVPHGEKRGRYYVAATSLREEFNEAREASQPETLDPFRQRELPLEVG